MSKDLNVHTYWGIQSVEGKKWQEQRYRNNGMVWGREPGPTVEGAADVFVRRGCKKVLVIGCGYGREVMYLAQQGLQVIGMDFSHEGIKLAEQWREEEGVENVSFYQGDALDLQFPDGSFDAIFTHKVIHQFRAEDRQKMISEMHRVLKQDGIFVLSDLSKADPEFGEGEEIETNMFERSKRSYRPLYFLSHEMLHEFEPFKLLHVEEIDFWETHPGENYEHKHAFMQVIGKKHDTR